MKKLFNKKGMSLISVIVYTFMFLIIMVIAVSLVTTTTTSNSIESEKLRFSGEKSQIHAILEQHSSSIVKSSLITSSVKSPTPINMKNDYEAFTDTLQYTHTATVDDGTGLTVTTNTDVKFTENEEGLLYTYVEKVTNPDGTVTTKEEKEMTFYTITDVKFDVIDKVCTEDTIDNGCISVTGLVDVSLYGEKEFMGRLSLNKSKRSFFFETKQEG